MVKSNKDYTLCIIDMQSFFVAAKNENIKGPILREIELAKQHKRNIVVVEYVGCGATKKYIKDALENYELKVYIKKHDDDGSYAIIDSGVITKNIRICGVNTNCCVSYTAIGLKKLGYNISVVKDACCAEGPETFRRSVEKIINTMSKKGIKILRNNRCNNLHWET